MKHLFVGKMNSINFKFFAFSLFYFFAQITHLSADWENLVYLATYPRSGNHWVRYLIEEAIGIATGADHIDPEPPHNPRPFDWGGYCPNGGYTGTRRYPEKNEIYVVKTHYPILKNEMPFRSSYKIAIQIVRHPLDSFYSWISYKNKHKKFYYFPDKELRSYLDEWILYQEFWDKQKNVLRIRYEDLIGDPYTYLKKILIAIGYECDEASILRAIDKYPPHGTPLKHLDKFSYRAQKNIKIKLLPFLIKFNYLDDF